MDYARFFSKFSSRQRQNMVRKMADLYLRNPNSISLAPGMPNAETFPIEEISITYRGGMTERLRGRELSTSLQYSSSQGHIPLREKMRGFQESRHAPQRKDWDVIFTVGSQDAIFKIFSMIIDDGEPVMSQTPTYQGILGVSFYRDIADSALLIIISMDFTKYYSIMAERRNSELVDILDQGKDVKVQLGQGLNNQIIVPFQELRVRLRDATELVFNENDMSHSFNLDHAAGCVPFVKKMREMQERNLSPVRNDWDIVPVTGAQDGIDRVFQAFINEDDALLVQTPMYFGIFGIITPLKPDFIGINQDADGVIPEEIEEVCEKRLKSGQPMPKLLYLNPTGANPTGACLTDERKKRVYELAQKYDFLILEDDPYYYLHFLDKQPTSLFSMDTDGRVIRLDSFSKILSAGIRLGVVTAHKDLIKKLIIHVENSILHTSTLSQMLVYKLFEAWTPKRFDEHFKEIQEFYRNKRDVMIASVEKHLTGLAEWTVPKGAMFVWVKVKGIDDVTNLVMEKCIANGVFVLPGNTFNYDGTKPSQHLRLCYSHATKEEIDEGLSIVARLIREELSKRQPATNKHNV